jgi:hypothetical protein
MTKFNIPAFRQHVTVWRVLSPFSNTPLTTGYLSQKYLNSKENINKISKNLSGKSKKSCNIWMRLNVVLCLHFLFCYLYIFKMSGVPLFTRIDVYGSTWYLLALCTNFTGGLNCTKYIPAREVLKKFCNDLIWRLGIETGTSSVKKIKSYIESLFVPFNNFLSPNIFLHTLSTRYELTVPEKFAYFFR